ncbi:thiamine pyrophosphate-binding protein [Streptomyces cupreus]|uniref:Thiamine pyrophosphate-binding protein n=1 Tax=Streptomyces cupreus TaxID=2759956 RepID=A0A7X1J027_9ACTN|nr:thiamine pyrophosphate-binding protein [Streptomyces cupreus]MBC2900812.1 thiamine pyrophosphate-binding protein [Streptomyces cupreus]
MHARDHLALQEIARTPFTTADDTARSLLELAGPDGPRLVGHLIARGREHAVDSLAAALDITPAPAAALTEALCAHAPRLTGAEAVAVVLAAAGVGVVFGYPGTSELALCDAVDRTPGMEMINGRGDKESAFMAAGAGLLSPGRGAAILHGARGLTNAGGALADARRNELGSVYVVGLPSTGSAAFLPPHGEENLLGAMGEFSDWWWQAPPVPEEPQAAGAAGAAFVARLREAVRKVRQAPHRPALIGVPQDVAERRWVPVAALEEPPLPPAARHPDAEVTMAAVGLLATAVRPVLLIDDYALRFDGVREGLDRVSRVLGAAVLQVRYRRGPMLFERLRAEEVTGFAGWLNPYSDAHGELLDRCDLLVTVEDRNIYPRVVGPLPGCRKIVLNTDAGKALKNGYLGPDDLVVDGDPGVALLRMAELLEINLPARPQTPWFGPEVAAESDVTPEPAEAKVVRARRDIAAAVAGALAALPRPVLVDDSQMFGGLLAESYDALPPGLRILGGHGGFVGSGIPLATGLAVSEPDRGVLCTLGDQAFTNSFQGLVAAVQQQARITYLVCNNGQSVSLLKQSAASGPDWFGAGQRPMLRNVPGLDYCAIARAIGVKATSVEVPVLAPSSEVSASVARLSEALESAVATIGPALVELRLPAEPEVWRGIWVTQGFETHRRVQA